MGICVEHLSFSYGNHVVLDNISFTAEAGWLFSILGPNGVGKSTLFRCILGLLHNYTGTITIDGKDMKPMSARELAKHIAYIPQAHYSSFNYSVFDMVLMGAANQLSSIGIPGRRQEKETMSALEKMGILHLKERGFSQISGGEQQLVLMARALVQNAPIWVLDEPVANLDFGNQIKVLNRLKKMTEEGYLIIQSTHNPEQTYLFSDRILALHKGKVIAQGKPEEIFNGELMKQLYDIDVQIKSLYEDRIRICVPASIIKGGKI